MKTKLHTVAQVKKIILLVEDEEMLLSLVKQSLLEKGYDVLEAKDGLEAINVFDEHRNEIDLAVIDVGLPQRGGLEVFRKMREINPKVKAIFTTGYIDQNIRSELLNAGASNFLEKPFPLNALLDVIHGTLYRDAV